MDLPQLHRMIHDFGGLQNIVDKKQWVKVADAMKIPKTVTVRFTAQLAGYTLLLTKDFFGKM